MSMIYIVGLGNPGKKYVNNRHNAGHLFIDFLNKKHISSCVCLKTDSFMNTSGSFVKKIVKTMNIDSSQLYIAHDDLDIPFGKFKIQLGTGPKVHNGVESVESSLGTEEFWRIRIGIDGRARGGDSADPAPRYTSGETYVLSDFSPEEQLELPTIFSEIYKKLSLEHKA